MPSLYEAKLNNNSRVLFFPNDIDIDYSNHDENYWTSSDLVKFILIASGSYEIVPSDNPFLDGNIKLPSISSVWLNELNNKYPNNKLSFRYEDVYESISKYE